MEKSIFCLTAAVFEQENPVEAQSAIVEEEAGRQSFSHAVENSVGNVENMLDYRSRIFLMISSTVALILGSLAMFFSTCCVAYTTVE